MRNSLSEKVIYDGLEGAVTLFRGEYIVYKKETGCWKPIFRESSKREAMGYLEKIRLC